MSQNEPYHPNMRRRRSALKSMKRKDTVGIILLGDENVGKTAVIKRWINDKFAEEYSPTVEEFFMKTIICLHRRVNVTVVDTAGSGQFPAMDELYIAKSDSIIFVYEIGNDKSIKSIRRYLESARKVLGSKKVSYSVIGTKLDTFDSTGYFGDDVATEYFTDLEDLPKQFLTSAKNNIGITEAFEHAISDVVRRCFPEDKRVKGSSKDISLIDDTVEEEHRRKCCTIL